jgi:hypothetical protein
MGGHAHELRELGKEESGVPGRAWVEYADGREVECILHRIGPRTWVAQPAEPVTLEEGAHLRLDRLGSDCQVRFLDVMRPVKPADDE